LIIGKFGAEIHSLMIRRFEATLKIKILFTNELTLSWFLLSLACREIARKRA